MLLLNSFFFLCFSYGQNTKNLALSYNPDDFIYDYNSSNELIIKSDKHTVTYDSDTLKPALPYISFHFLIDKNMDFDTINYQATDSCVFENVKLQANPKIIPTNVKNTGFSQRIVEYDEAVYPNKNVLYHGTHIMDGYKTLTLSVCPFVYDNRNKKLRLITSLDISISLKENALSRSTVSPFIGSNMRNVVKSLIYNKEDLEAYYPDASTQSAKSTNNQQTKYVIITCDSLVSSFQPLADWKKVKGLQAKIITTEYINQNYPGTTSQLKIKNCLYDLYQNHGLQYALLGGDDQIVPVQYCWVDLELNNQYAYPIHKFVPVDMFYSNFNNNFEWNENNNDTIGEIDDNIDFTSEIYLSRVPIRSKDDVAAFVDKILSYEKNPPINNWKDCILMVGVNMSGESEKLGTEETKGDSIYQTYINFNNSLWTGNKFKLYDSYSDIIGNQYQCKPFSDVLQNQLSKGFSFVNVMSHGGPTNWMLLSNYNTLHAYSLQNIHPTIITTSACMVNCFDYDDEPSLSEAFIRGRSNNVLAFIGCSRETFSSNNKHLLGMDLFIALLYRHIFDSSTNKCLSVAFNMVKNNPSILNYIERTDMIERWQQYCLNTIGDPEMPIYPSVPKTLDSLVVDTIYDGSYIITGERYNSALITITGVNADGSDYLFQKSLHDSTTENFRYYNLPNPATFCITRSGYVPFVFTIKDKKIYLQNTTHNGRHHIKSNSFAIGKDVIDNDFNGPVKVLGGTLNIKYKDNVTINKDFEVKQGATLSISKE